MRWDGDDDVWWDSDDDVWWDGDGGHELDTAPHDVHAWVKSLAGLYHELATYEEP